MNNFNLDLINYYENLKNIKYYDLNDLFIKNNNDWLFSFTENLFSYSYYTSSYFLENSVFQDNYSISRKYFWYKTMLQNEYNVLSSLILDQLTYLSLIILPFFDGFFKNLLNSFEFKNLIMFHPEYIFIVKNYMFINYNNYFSNIYLSNYNLVLNESYLSPVLLLSQFLLFYGLIILFLSMYFVYYNNPNSEDNILDHDYLIYNVTIEAEEEIGSMDDMLLTSVILLYIFLWFFWIYSWSSISITPQLTMSIFLFPMIYFIIFFIPFSLLYDYGSYFLSYLNGVGKSSILLLELLFDYIAVSIFYLRLMVQNVRLVFMLFTYTELHELIVFYTADKNILINDESINSSWDDSKTFFNSTSYFLFFKLPTNILNWLYELFHTFFMVIFQFIAFFAMIFWLFLFLYTMFVYETQENYLFYKRSDFKKYKDFLLNVKIS